MLCEKEGLSRSEWALWFTCNWQWLTSIELAWTKRQNFKCKFQWLSPLSWFTKYVVWMRRKCGEIEFILGSVTQVVCSIKEIHAPLNSMLASGISQNRRKKKIQRYSISTILLLIQRKKDLVLYSSSLASIDFINFLFTCFSSSVLMSGYVQCEGQRHINFLSPVFKLAWHVSVMVFYVTWKGHI